MPLASQYLLKYSRNLMYMGSASFYSRNAASTSITFVPSRPSPSYGNQVGQAHQNLILDTQLFEVALFEVEFLDVTRQAITANTIVENFC